MKHNAVPVNIGLLESVLDATPDGISVLEPNLNIVWRNATMRKWYPRSEPSNGFKCYQLYHLSNHPCRDCPVIRSLESGKLSMEIVPLPKTQQGAGWVELYAFPLLNATGVSIGAVEYVRNITDRVTIEQELRKTLITTQG